MKTHKILKEKEIHFTPVIVINVGSLDKIPLIEMENNNKNGMLNQISDLVKPVMNYKWANNVIRISNTFADEFSFSVYLNKINNVPKGWEINIWNHKGSSTVGVWNKKYESDNDCLNTEELNDIRTRLNEYSCDVQHCSDCNATMPTDKEKRKTDRHNKEYGGQYFAGRFCKDCWEKKWKAIEAKETYN